MKCSRPQRSWRRGGAWPAGSCAWRRWLCSPAPSLTPHHTLDRAEVQAGCPAASEVAALYQEAWHDDRGGQVARRWYLAPAGEGSASPGGLRIAPWADLGSQIKLETET